MKIETFEELKALDLYCPICQNKLLFSSEVDRHIENMSGYDDEEDFYYFYCTKKSSDIKQYHNRPAHLGHYSVMYDYSKGVNFKTSGQGFYHKGGANFFIKDYFATFLTFLNNAPRLDVDIYDRENNEWVFSFSLHNGIQFSNEEKFVEDLDNYRLLM